MEPWAAKAKALASGLFDIPYITKVSITIKCQVPIPPGEGATMPKLAITKTVKPVITDKCEVNLNAQKIT